MALLVFGNGQTANGEVAPCSEFSVTVFAKDVTVNGLSGNASDVGNSLTKTSSVQRSTGTDNLFLREAGNLPGSVGQDVNWVSSDKEDTVETRFNDWVNNGIDNAKVLVNEVETSFARLLRCTGSNYNEVCVSAVAVVSGVNLLWGSEWQCVGKVNCVTLRLVLHDINDTDFLSDALLDHRECVTRTNGPVTDEDYFLMLNSFCQCVIILSDIPS